MCALIPAAGRGARFGGTENKVFAPLLGKPLLAWTLDAFARCTAVNSIVLVGAADDLPRLRALGEQYGGGKLQAVALGGDDRQASVLSGLARITDEYVAVHDAARPLVTPALISDVLAAARETGAATAATPQADTLVRADGTFVGEAVPRDGLWAIQTPQIFRRALLLEAHDRAASEGFRGTDDAGLVRRLGHSVTLVGGWPDNLKVTHPEDLAHAEAVIGGRWSVVGGQTATPVHRPLPTDHRSFRIGHGYDVHPFAEGRMLFLGGVEFPDAPRGLLGHSDADVILHAVCDALLGAAGLGDIGKLFPPSDMRHKDRRSTEFLAEVCARVREAGWQICNIDISVLAETPKIGPKSGEIRRTIGVICAIDPNNIGLKATTNEGLGSIGRGEGIAVHATTLLASR